MARIFKFTRDSSFSIKGTGLGGFIYFGYDNPLLCTKPDGRLSIFLRMLWRNVLRYHWIGVEGSHKRFARCSTCNFWWFMLKSIETYFQFFHRISVLQKFFFKLIDKEKGITGIIQCHIWILRLTKVLSQAGEYTLPTIVGHRIKCRPNRLEIIATSWTSLSPHSAKNNFPFSIVSQSRDNRPKICKKFY